MTRRQTSSPLYLAIDQGGHSSRTILFDQYGSTVACAHLPVTEQRLSADRVEQDPTALLASIRTCLEELTVEPDLNLHDVVAVGIATQRASLCCWHRGTGQALTPVISWQDRRADEWLRQFRTRQSDIQRRTGLTLSPHYGASKFHWCLENVAPVKQALEAGELCMGPLASFLLFSLLQEQPFCVDPANASRTLLCNLNTRDWDDELLKLFQVPRPALPTITPTRSDFGHLALGDQLLPLTVCNGDQSAALFAHGRPQSHNAYVNIGTGAFVSLPCPAPPEDSHGLLCSLILDSTAESIYVLEGTVNGAGSALDWLAQQQQISADVLYKQLPIWLDGETTPPLFLNGISGLGAPFWQADFPSRFIGDGSDASRAVAVAESILFLIVVILQRMQNFDTVTTLHISGGLSRIDTLCQRLADLGGMPVFRTQECEATAQGLAWLLAEDPDDWQVDSRPDLFQPAENPELRDRFIRWEQAMSAALKEEGRGSRD